MEVKKLVLAVFIVFTLSFAPHSANLIAKQRDVIVYILNYNEDSFTGSFIRKNKTKRFALLVSLTLQCMLIKNGRILFNTS